MLLQSVYLDVSKESLLLHVILSIIVDLCIPSKVMTTVTRWQRAMIPLLAIFFLI